MCIKKKKTQQTAFKFFVRGIKSLYFVTRQEVNSMIAIEHLLSSA